jgi:hypothetical protein
VTRPPAPWLVNKQTTVYLPHDLLRWLKDRAAADGVKFSALVTRYCEEGRDREQETQ